MMLSEVAGLVSVLLLLALMGQHFLRLSNMNRAERESQSAWAWIRIIVWWLGGYALLVSFTWERALIAGAFILGFVVARALVTPSNWADFVFIPLGWLSLSRVAGSLSWRRFSNDARAGSYICGALALLRSPAGTRGASIEQVVHELNVLPGMVTAERLYARALLESCRGDQPSMLRTLEMARTMFESETSVWVRARIIETLAMAALMTQRDERARELLAGNEWRSPLTKLLAAVANGSSRWTVWNAWLRAPHRQHTKRLIRIVRERQPRAVAHTPSPRATLEDALRVSLSAQGALESLATWETLFNDGSLRQRLSERAVLIGGGDPDHAITELRDVLTLSAQASVSDELTISEDAPALLKLAVEGHKSALYDSLNVEMANLLARMETNHALPRYEEIETVSRIKTLYFRMQRRWPHERAVLFSLVGVPLTNHAVWLFNRDEEPFANAMFHFLADEARQAGNDELYAVNSRNLARYAPPTEEYA